MDDGIGNTERRNNPVPIVPGASSKPCQSSHKFSLVWLFVRPWNVQQVPELHKDISGKVNHSYFVKSEYTKHGCIQIENVCTFPQLYNIHIPTHKSSCACVHDKVGGRYNCARAQETIRVLGCLMATESAKNVQKTAYTEAFIYVYIF